MPVVPQNTISEVRKVRLPGINYAEPRMAEAMGGVASALGRRAGAIGELAETRAQMANALGKQGEMRERSILAKAEGTSAMWNTLGKLGSQAMQTGVELDRIADRRAEQEANIALSQDKIVASKRWNGYFDENGQPVQGIRDTPYRPANEKDPADGPSIGMARVLRELKENEDGAFAKLSPRAKKHYQDKESTLTVPLMELAANAEYNQIQTYRQNAAKLSKDANTTVNRNMSLATDSGGISVRDATQAAIVRQDIFTDYGHLQADPQNTDLEKARWNTPQVASEVKAATKARLQFYRADTAATLLAAAENEQDAGRREAYLREAASVIGSTVHGKELFDPQERAEVVKQIEAVRFRANAKKASLHNFLQDRATKLNTAIVLGQYGGHGDLEQMNAELQRILPQLEPMEQAAVMEQAGKNLEADDSMRFDSSFNAYAADPTPENRRNVERTIESMMSDNAKNRAIIHLRQADTGEQSATDARLIRHGETAAQFLVDSRTEFDAAGRPRYLQDDEVLGRLNDMALRRELSPARYRTLKEQLAKSDPPDEAYMKQITDFMQDKIGNPGLAGMFVLSNGAVSIAETTKTTRGEKVVTPAAAPDEDIGDIQGPFGVPTTRPWYAPWRDPIYTVDREQMDIDAQTVQAIMQAGLDYAKMDKIPAKDGTRPPTLQEFLENAIDADTGIGKLRLNKRAKDHFNTSREIISRIQSDLAAREYQSLIQSAGE